MDQAAFFIQLHPDLCLNILWTVLALWLASKCLAILSMGLYQPRNVGDDDLLTIKDFDNDHRGTE